METSLNLFKAHIVLLMFSYVNAKAITLISLFVGFGWFCSSIKVKNKSLDTPKPLNTAASHLGFTWGQDRTWTT